MSDDVYANGREISCKKADGKTICEFPDVCFTPPENPATPPGVPVPYPNTAFAKDTTEGSKTVMISGQEVMLKNKSYFKTSSGDEAGAAAKKGVITSTNKGKAYFISWSMDVKFEGENVVRHIDMTTNNHASPKANGSVPMGYRDRTASSKGKKDVCTHKNNKKKELYVIYAAPDRKNPGKTYIGRARGKASWSFKKILAKRKSTHHRNLGKMRVVCATDSYAAIRGAEYLHYLANKRKTKQDSPLSPRHSRRDDYIACAKKTNKNCPICSA
jgi:hypothetical protein